MLPILEAMLVNQMIVLSGGGAFGASATTRPELPAEARRPRTTHGEVNWTPLIGGDGFDLD